MASISLCQEPGISVRKSWILGLYEWIEKCINSSPASDSFFIYDRFAHIVPFEITRDSIPEDLA